MQESGERDFKSTRSAGLIARGGALWKNTVDKAVWSQPVEGLGFQDRGFGRCPGGRRSQRRLGKRVGLMKEFLCHSRNSLAQLILLLGEQSHSLASNVPPIQKKKTHIYQPLQGSHGEFTSAGSERKMCFTWHPGTSVRDACPQRRTG